MKTTIDSAGRLVIPRDIRREAGLRPGMPLDIRLREGHIEIEPASVPLKLVRKGKLLIAIPRADVAALTADTVERTRRAIRRRGSEQS